MGIELNLSASPGNQIQNWQGNMQINQDIQISSQYMT